MKRNAEGLRALDLTLDAVFHSPLRRSRSTAKIVARSLRLRAALTPTDALLPEADPREILHELSGHAAGASVLLVCHEPHMGRLAAALLGSKDLRLTFKKGGIARIDTARPEPGSGRLEWLLTASQLRMIGTGR